MRQKAAREHLARLFDVKVTARIRDTSIFIEMLDRNAVEWRWIAKLR
jgi:hypothetical protein